MTHGIVMFLLAAAVLQSPEEVYRKDYAEVVEIQGLADPAQQVDRCLAFLTARKDSQLISSIATTFNESLNKLTQAKNWAKISEVSDRWLALRPEDKGPLLFALNASQEAGNWARVTELGEKAFAAAPDNGIAYSLAIAYSQLKNAAKLAQYGEIVVKNLPIDQSWSIAYELVSQNIRDKSLAKAAEYANLILTGFGANRPSELQAAQWSTTRTYLMETVGRSAYEARQYPQAIELYNNVLKANPRSDEAYYYIGESLRRQQKLDDAMMAFAKAAVLNRGHSARARQLLEEIYKATHANQLAGIEQVLDLARKQLAAR